LKKLFEGLHRFRTDVFQAEKELFQRLAEGQNPEVLFITCSDSRVVPSLLTQTKAGDLFILRNAGNLVPPFGTGDLSQDGTIEYAVSALGVRDIVVCGHSCCGAVTALLQPESTASMPRVRAWLQRAEATRCIIEENYSHLEGDELLRTAIEANVLVQLSNLKTHPSVAARLTRGDLNLHGWVYEFQQGEVRVYDPEVGGFSHLDDPLSQIQEKALPSEAQT
jgi:carbonic anhydrase